MKDKSVLMLVIVVVAALAAIVAICYVLLFEEEPIIGPAPSMVEKEIIPSPATGNIDDAVDALLKELADENTLLTDEENDVSVLSNDNTEINEFGSSVNEKEL